MNGFWNKYWAWYINVKKILAGIFLSENLKLFTSHIIGWICFDSGTLRLSQISYLWEFLGQIARFWVSRSSTGHICSPLIGTLQLWIPWSVWYWTPCSGLLDPTYTSTLLYLSCRPCSWMLSCGLRVLIWTLVHIARSRIIYIYTHNQPYLYISLPSPKRSVWCIFC